MCTSMFQIIFWSRFVAIIQNSQTIFIRPIVQYALKSFKILSFGVLVWDDAMHEVCKITLMEETKVKFYNLTKVS